MTGSTNAVIIIGGNGNTGSFDVIEFGTEYKSEMDMTTEINVEEEEQ